MKNSFFAPELAGLVTEPAFCVEVGQLVRSVLNPCLLAHYYIGLSQTEALRSHLLARCLQPEVAAYLSGMQGYRRRSEAVNLTRFLYVVCWWMRRHPQLAHVRLSRVASVLWTSSLVPFQRYGSARQLAHIMRDYTVRLPREVAELLG